MQSKMHGWLLLAAAFIEVAGLLSLKGAQGTSGLYPLVAGRRNSS